jgi:hypothetical protein
LDHHTKKHAIDGSCITYEGEEKCVQGLDGGNVKKELGRTRHRWEDSILKWILTI